MLTSSRKHQHIYQHELILEEFYDQHINTISFDKLLFQQCLSQIWLIILHYLLYSTVLYSAQHYAEEGPAPASFRTSLGLIGGLLFAPPDTGHYLLNLRVFATGWNSNELHDTLQAALPTRDVQSGKPTSITSLVFMSFHATLCKKSTK